MLVCEVKMANKFIFNGDVKNSIIGSSIHNNSIEHPRKMIDPGESLLKDLIDKAHRVMERNSSQVKLEDLHNDDFTHWLRDKGYYVTDQTRSGRSAVSVGEVDIMVRSKNGTPVSIIEAFRLTTCGDSNSIVDKHINKLLSNYDTAGLVRNFILIYAESPDFMKLWMDYFTYTQKLNDKINFTSKHKLISFKDVTTEFVHVTDIKVGLAEHSRQNSLIEVYHVFINMYR